MLRRTDASLATAPAIEIRDVEKSFGPLKVLKGVRLSIASGEVMVLCGPSGCGKSTLLRCLNGLEAVDRGEILYDARPARVSRSRLRRLDSDSDSLRTVLRAPEPPLNRVTAPTTDATSQ